MKNIFIFPCNPNYFDIDSFFLHNSTIIWRKPSNIELNDIVYIYISSTIKEVKYKCIVTDVCISEEMLSQNSYAIPRGKIAATCSYIGLTLLHEYESGMFPLTELKDNGMGQFMVPMKANEKLKAYFMLKDK